MHEKEDQALNNFTANIGFVNINVFVMNGKGMNRQNLHRLLNSRFLIWSRDKCLGFPVY